MKKQRIFILIVLIFTGSILWSVDLTKMEIVYKVPGVEKIKVKQQVYKKSGDKNLVMDIYYPLNIKKGLKLPVVVFVFGYSDIGAKKSIGSKLKDFKSYVTWSKLVAASGMIAVTYETIEPRSDTRDLLNYIDKKAVSLRMDKGRLCLWSCSANGPTALSLLMDERDERIKCGVLYYSFMPAPDGKFKTVLESLSKQFGFSTEGMENIKHFHSDLPLFIVRAGLDSVPRLNDVMDHFILQALSYKVPLTLINYTNGHHAFDLVDKNNMSRHIIRQTVEFMKFHLFKK